MHWLLLIVLTTSRAAHPSPVHANKATRTQPLPTTPAAAPAPPSAPAAASPAPPPTSTSPTSATSAPTTTSTPPPPTNQSEKVESVEPVVVADDDSTDQSNWYSDAYPIQDRVFDAYTARTVRKGTINFYVNHRNNEGIFENPLRDLLGFDGGSLKIGLALRYGIFDWLDAGIYRQNGTVEVFNTYEFDARVRFFSPTATLPVELAARVGLSWFNMPESNALAGFAQIIADSFIYNRALVGGSLLFSSNSSGPTKRQSDTLWTGAFNLHGDVRLLEYLSVGGELTWGVLGYHDTYPIITIGPKFITNRHTFAIVITNSQYMTTDSIVANTYRIAPKSWILGFNISREF